MNPIVFAAPKPKKDGTGTTIQFSMDIEAGFVFMTLAKQNSDTSIENARFDYENKLVFKISTVELAEFIRVFSGITDSINGEKGLFHNFKNVKSTIKCNKNDPKYGGFFVKAFKGDVGIGAKLTDAEAVVLKTIFEKAISTIYKW